MLRESLKGVGRSKLQKFVGCPDSTYTGPGLDKQFFV